MSRVLKEHKELGTFLHLTKKNEIKELERKLRHAGRKPYSEQDDWNRGGKPSAYMQTEELKKLKNVMEKPGATELFYTRIDKWGLAHKLMKYIMLAVVYAAKMDEKAFPVLVSFGASSVQYELKEEDITVMKKLQLYDDNQAEEFADSAAKDFLRNRDPDKFFVAASGLFKF